MNSLQRMAKEMEIAATSSEALSRVFETIQPEASRKLKIQTTNLRAFSAELRMLNHFNSKEG
jgi:hypothetical protein